MPSWRGHGPFYIYVYLASKSHVKFVILIFHQRGVCVGFSLCKACAVYCEVNRALAARVLDVTNRIDDCLVK